MIASAVGISLEVGCDFSECAELAGPLLSKLSTGYEECAVMPLPSSITEWREPHRTARKRADRCARRGYWAGELARDDWAADIHAINTSKATRQKRPMAVGYLDRQEFSALPDYACERHAIRTSGVWAPDGHLVAYIVVYRCGELALVSQVLGHGDHERNEVMYLLFEFAIYRELWQGWRGGFLVYNRWDSGTDGLRWFKERLGFRPMEVEWLS